VLSWRPYLILLPMSSPMRVTLRQSMCQGMPRVAARGEYCHREETGSEALGHPERGHSLSAAHGYTQSRAVCHDGRCLSSLPLFKNRHRFHFDQQIWVGKAPHFDRGTGEEGVLSQIFI
jgi:hypothetical protein